MGKSYSQIVCHLCIESEFKENLICCAATSTDFKNQGKLIPSILEKCNDGILDNYLNDFSLCYSKPTNSQELPLNKETPVVKSHTTAQSVNPTLLLLQNNNENQFQILGNQIPHNTTHFILHHTLDQLLSFHITKNKKFIKWNI